MMAQEDKELLLKDLCSRLNHKTYVRGESREGYFRYSRAKLNSGMINDFERDNNIYKPYLRPMSSMTDEERKIYMEIGSHLCGEIVAKTMIDWLKAHHFDYRGLIEKGLAIEATKNMYES